MAKWFCRVGTPIFVVLLLLSTRQTVLAESGLGVAHDVLISDTEIMSGDIVSYSDNSYHRSREAYDKNIFGVVDTNPAMELADLGVATGSSPVISNGLVLVRVNAQNGPIKIGDPVTSSSMPGIGMKATKSGFVLGVAQTDFFGSGEEIGTIFVSLDIKFYYYESSLNSEAISQRLTTLASGGVGNTAEVFRRILAALIAIGSIVFAFVSVAQTARKGTEALGRNPLASNQIITGMVLNVILSVLILTSGLVAAYVIIKV